MDRWLKVKLTVEIDEKENVGLYLQNESGYDILTTSVIGQLLQWKDNKFVITKQLSMKDRAINEDSGYGWGEFVPVAKWKNASPRNDWTSSLPPSNSTDRQLFTISANDGVTKYLLFMVKATIALINFHGKMIKDAKLIKALNIK